MTHTPSPETLAKRAAKAAAANFELTRAPGRYDIAAMHVPNWATKYDQAITAFGPFNWSLTCPICQGNAEIHLREQIAPLYRCAACLSDINDLLSRFPVDDTCCNRLIITPGAEAGGTLTAEEMKRIRALGYTMDGLYVYQNTLNGVVRFLKPKQLANDDLIALYSNRDYWKRWAGATEMGAPRWGKIKDDMLEAANTAGLYRPDSVRGAGMFWDTIPDTDKNGHRRRVIVTNLGNSLLVDDKLTSFADFEGRGIYASSLPIDLPAPLSSADVQRLQSLVDRLPWARPGSAHCLAGFIICGMMAGILKWRPHLWLMGGQGSGKSAIMKQVVAALSKPIGGLYLDNATTAAGIKQALMGCTLVALDEGESHGRGQFAKRRMEEIIALYRSMSPEEGAAEAKGTAGGVGRKGILRACGIIASIYHSIDKPEDFSRFALLSLKKPKKESDSGAWEALSAELNDTFTEDYTLGLYARVIQDARRILDVIAKFTKTMRRKGGILQRDCDQYGTLAGTSYWVSHPDTAAEDITEDEIEAWFGGIYVKVMPEEEDADSHGAMALYGLLAAQPKFSQSSIGEAVMDCVTTKQYKLSHFNGQQEASREERGAAQLQKYGMRVDYNKGGALVLKIARTRHTELQEIMERIGYPNYKDVLESHPAARSEKGRCWFGTHNSFGWIEFSVKDILEEAQPPAPKTITEQEAEEAARPVTWDT